MLAYKSVTSKPLRQIFYTFKRNAGCPSGFDKIFQELRIVPDILDETPRGELTLYYTTKITLASDIKPLCVGTVPTLIESPNIKKDSLHTLIFTDPDFIKKAGGDTCVKIEFLQWMVVNIPGSNLKEGDTIAEYLGPLPKQFTGRHRMVFNLFEQCYKIDLSNETMLNNKTIRGRCGFSTRLYQDKHILQRSLAGTFFNSEHDNSVDRAYVRLQEGAIEEDAMRRENMKGPYCCKITKSK